MTIWDGMPYRHFLDRLENIPTNIYPNVTALHSRLRYRKSVCRLLYQTPCVGWCFWQWPRVIQRNAFTVTLLSTPYKRASTSVTATATHCNKTSTSASMYRDESSITRAFTRTVNKNLANAKRACDCSVLCLRPKSLLYSCRQLYVKLALHRTCLLMSRLARSAFFEGCGSLLAQISEGRGIAQQPMLVSEN